MKTFKELGLKAEILKSLDDLGFTEPSPIQAEAIPFILKSKYDLTALAQTGTGKTAAFSLPILQQIKTDGKSLQAIVLCPTRELCLQISQDIKGFTKYSKGIVVTSVYGGESIGLQIRALKSGTNIVVGTPGRVHDLIRRKILKLQSIEWLVLDEADEMLDRGFKEDLNAILAQIPTTRRTLLFSATMSKGINSIARQYMNNVYEISIGNRNVGADMVTHEYYVVQIRDRFEALKRILDYLPDVYGILFCRTRRETQEIADRLRQADYDVEAIHGDISQNIRTKIMDRFKKKQIRLLVATDVAARGLDVKNLTHVINYSLPDQNISYTHRSGRTGRAEQSGISIAMISPRDIRKIKELERIIGKSFEYKQVPTKEDVYRKLIDNFIDAIKHPDFEVPINEQYVSEIIDKLKSVKKEDLIKYFVTKELTRLADDSKNICDLNAGFQPLSNQRRGAGESVNLKINFGKKQGFDIKSFFSLVNAHKNLQSVDIGRINLRPEDSIFAVNKNCAHEIIELLTGREFKGEKIKICESDEKVEDSYLRKGYPGIRRGGQNRKFQGNRSGGSRNNFRKGRRGR